MWLSPHFHLSEFIKSNEATRRGIDNTPSAEVVNALTDLCRFVLEPIRMNYGQPIRVSSGYRSPALNAAVGGSRNSQHVLGKAADIEIIDLDNCDLALWIASNLEFDQLILEFHNHSAGPNDGWVHVSYDSQGNKNQVLTAKTVNSKTVYLNGLVQ
jgi:zinc D-Ala-D-Ala carboxypeptidase